MESAAISGARWVVGKALSPLSDGLVEAWAASSELGPNIEALKMELLYAQAMLNNARDREIHNPALAELLQRLRGLAYGAEDVLDELDYFRIQDKLEGTFETVDDRGCARNLVRDARLTAKAAGKQLQCTSCFTSAARATGGVPYEHGEQGVRRRSLLCGAWPGSAGAGADDEPACKCVRGLASRARTTAHAVGKRFLCSSLPTVRNDQVDGGGQHSSTNKNGKQVICGACRCTCMAPRKKQAPKTPKLDFDRVEISKKMKYIVEQLQPICAKVSTVLELELLSSSRSIGHDTSTGRSITISESTEPKLYGRDHEKNTIVQDITKGEYFDKHLTVIPIVGPGGIGKTTLTQYIYNNQEVQEHFQIRVWVCVSLDFNVYRLTQQIAKTIPKAEDEKNDGEIDGLQNLDQLQKLVEKRLKNRRFLLVLDDIWNYGNEYEWNKLLVPFTKGQVKGNTVLVTTRFLEVAEMVKRNNEVIQLDRLKPADFWDFFIACVFGHGETKQHLDDDLNSIGIHIVEKLKGSPLAAKTVGRLLRNNLTSSYWTRVLESKEWESRTSDDDIMPALKLSYDYLPFHLQQCFSYCALYPEDYKFDSEELIRFWIGLDILRPSHATKRLEDIGLDYLNELVNYGFFKEEIKKQGIYVGYNRKEKEEWVINFVIHDLLHDLALKVSSQECLHIASSSPTPIEVPPSIYHLSISMSPANSTDGNMGENFRKELGKIRNRMKSENLHTLMIFGEYDASFVGTFNDLFKDAKSLRVVNLFTMSQPVESVLHNFSKLVHLRYLRLASDVFSNIGISDERRIHLPSSLSRFYHLRVLDIASWYGAHSLSGNMTNLVKLRHFLVPIEELHSNISNVGKLHCLQELRRFQVKKENNGFELRELGQLAELGGSLGIYNLENVQVNEAHEAKLLYRNRLQKLTLNWNKDRCNKNPDKEDAVLESLRPHSNLHELRIDGHGGFTCPTWLDTGLSIKGLEALHLVGVAWKSLPSLGQMWMLNELTLEGIDMLNEFGPFSLTTEQSFHNLERLTFISLKRLGKWAVGDTHQLFSALQVLVIRDCPELLELPFMSNSCYLPEQDGNINWLPNLQEFEIVNCPKVLSLPPIPWTHTLCHVNMIDAGSIHYNLKYHANSSSEVKLSIDRKTNLPSLDGKVFFYLENIDEKVLVSNNLTEVHELHMWFCPPLELKHLQMLTSLKALVVHSSINVLGNLGDAEWQLPVERLEITNCGASGQELTQLLSHLPKLSDAKLLLCKKITRLVVEAEQQRTATPISLPSCSAIKMEDTQATADHNQQIAGEVEEEEEEEEEGLLLFPPHLSNSLRELKIIYSPELILLAPPTSLNGHRTEGDQGGEGGLQALRSLQKLVIDDCPKFLSNYMTSSSFSSSCCPFPSSLRELELRSVEGMETLEPLSNLTSLTRLTIRNCGEDLRCEGLLPLLTQGQLSDLTVLGSRKFFVGWDPMRGKPQDEQEQLRLSTSSRPLHLWTGDVAGVLAAPFCSLLSSSLTELLFSGNKEVERFTNEQVEALYRFTSLQQLSFWSCDKLQRLPAGLNRLTNLKILSIQNCPGIRSLPKDGLPSSLQELDVVYCDNEELKRRCRRLMGTIPIIIL